MKYDMALKPETKLERHVACWLRSQARERDGSIAAVAEDLVYGGCASGIVGHLVYYTDTLRFEARYRKEINALLTEALTNGCVSSVSQLSGWDTDDPRGFGTVNRNVLAWFGFEEAARALLSRAGWDR